MKKLLLFGTVFLALVLVTSPAWGMTKDQLVARVAAKTGKSTTTQGESAVEAAIPTEIVSMSLKGAKHEFRRADSFFDIFTDLKIADGDNIGVLLRGVDKKEWAHRAHAAHGSGGWMKIMKAKRAGDYESGGFMKIMKARMADGDSGNWMKIMKSRRMKLDGKGTDNAIEELELAVEEIKLRRAGTETSLETDAEIRIPAKKVVRFKAGSDLSKTVA